MRYNDRKTILIANKNDKRMERINSSPSDREERRKYRPFIKKLVKIAPDKYWFESLSILEKIDIYNRYRSESSSWQFDNCTFIDKELFWEEMKVTYPGDISKRRNDVISEIFRNDRSKNKV